MFRGRISDESYEKKLPKTLFILLAVISFVVVVAVCVALVVLFTKLGNMTQSVLNGIDLK